MFTFSKINIVFKAKGHYLYQLSHYLTISAPTQSEIKVVILLLNRLISEKKININKRFLRRISVDYLEADTWAECDPDNKCIILNRLVLDDLLRNLGSKKRKHLVFFMNKIYEEFGVYLIHEYVHCIDYNTEFSLSENTLGEYYKAINLMKKKIIEKHLFQYSKKDDILFDYSEGLPYFKEMSPKAFHDYHKKHKKIVKDLGYVTPYSLTSPQEFVAEHIAFYIMDNKTLEGRPKLKKIIHDLSFFITNKIS
jgi:hypothetical protein